MMKGSVKNLQVRGVCWGADPQCTWPLAEGPHVRGGMVCRTRTGFSQFVQATCEPWLQSITISLPHRSQVAWTNCPEHVWVRRTLPPRTLGPSARRHVHRGSAPPSATYPQTFYRSLSTRPLSISSNDWLGRVLNSCCYKHRLTVGSHVF